MWKLFEGRWKIVIGFAAVFAFIAGLNLVISKATIDISPLPVETAATASPAKARNDTSVQFFADLALPDTLARPVFSPTRRNFIEPPRPVEVVGAFAESESVPAAPLKPPSIKLQGTRIVDGKPSVLIAMDEKTATWLGEGDTVGGWKISSIAADRMSLNSGSENVVFSLYETTKGWAGAAN